VIEQSECNNRAYSSRGNNAFAINCNQQMQSLAVLLAQFALRVDPEVACRLTNTWQISFVFVLFVAQLCATEDLLKLTDFPS
jgi:hypothetical protein